jgi:hypothetical protein
MNLFKKIYNWDKKQLDCPENLLGISIALGVVFGYGTGNVGVGIALGVAIGAGLATKRKKAIAKEKRIKQNQHNHQLLAQPGRKEAGLNIEKSSPSQWAAFHFST